MKERGLGRTLETNKFIRKKDYPALSITLVGLKMTTKEELL